MNLKYIELLSPEPYFIEKVGSIISPTLRVVSKNMDTYNFYLSLLSMNSEGLFKLVNQEEIYNKLSEEDKSELDVFDLITSDGLIFSEIKIYEYILGALQYFFVENVTYSVRDKVFKIFKDSEMKDQIGLIDKNNYHVVTSVILQRNYIKQTEEINVNKIKSKKALSIMEKLKKGREAKEKASKNSKNNLDIGNVISGVSNFAPNINPITIWEMTIYQLYDSFYRNQINNIMELCKSSASYYGNKDGVFNPTEWYKAIEI